ncbi:hypothetical protein EVG20_g8231 [Dentipellis fragilis]|uniref:Pre-mRNA processing factor 4 (PRP4)-like domain-containing protein n=1 Tax=Dentipellis fragilis TaxID=205917 RepID=A0A4Y9Y9T8_9AGAM|nr:hypothetical protein EVG20_g8231 [Dentipellis fragilis]
MDDESYLGSERARIENQVILDELERKKKARSMAVPTDDNRVKARLREIGEPITLFGERAADRRDRLIYVLSQINAARGDEAMQVEEESSEESEEEVEEFYTPGSLELLQARRRLAEFSLPRLGFRCYTRAQKRVAQQRIDSKMPLGRIIDMRKHVLADVKSFSNLGSQIGDERPVSQVRFSPNNEMLATGSWSGSVKLWNVPACTPIRTLRGHSDRVGGVAWHPQATLTQSPDAVNLASGAGDTCVNLWSLNSETPLAVMKGHQDRVCRVAFHPSGDYVASASFDTTWRLWDVTTSKELLLQEGHSKEVYAVEFQDDGALVASAGLDAIGRVWDLRTGRTAMILDGHVQGILSLSFSPNGAVHDPRAPEQTSPTCASSAPTARSQPTSPPAAAHPSTSISTTAPTTTSTPQPDGVMDETATDTPAPDGDVETANADASQDQSQSQVLLEQEWHYRPGLYLASAGYDGVVKVWSADDWQLLTTLQTDGSKAMSVDLSRDARMLVSGTYNRNFQLFGTQSAGL